MKQAQWKMETEIGTLYLVASEKGLQGIFWNPQSAPMNKTPLLEEACRQIQEYFHGKRQNFDVPLDIQGTPFQMKVWKALSKIPYGKTVSYKDIAHKIQNAKAVRAVGGANGANPVCILIPCHRVIAADGSIGGYTGGLDIKRKLLELERKGRVE